ncbi:MAG: (d)CMP kinase [Clostridia bacterium]|nr:(d)CMP kinase [Clostridia bacterium]
MEKHFTIAIDGPAGCGKSTVAREISKRLGIIYLDTGSMYRAVAYTALKSNIDIKSENDGLLNLLKSMTMEITYTEGNPNVIVNGENVTPYLRSEEVSMGASTVAKLAAVRKRLVELQQEIAKSQSVVMDGRDIGTKVIPETKNKFFLTATVEERAKRRFLDVKETGVTIEEVKADIIKRDENDTKRAESPLVKAEDAFEIDTSDLTALEVTEKILERVEKDVL